MEVISRRARPWEFPLALCLDLGSPVPAWLGSCSGHPTWPPVHIHALSQAAHGQGASCLLLSCPCCRQALGCHSRGTHWGHSSFGPLLASQLLEVGPASPESLGDPGSKVGDLTPQNLTRPERHICKVLTVFMAVVCMLLGPPLAGPGTQQDHVGSCGQHAHGPRPHLGAPTGLLAHAWAPDKIWNHRPWDVSGLCVGGCSPSGETLPRPLAFCMPTANPGGTRQGAGACQERPQTAVGRGGETTPS